MAPPPFTQIIRHILYIENDRDAHGQIVDDACVGFFLRMALDGNIVVEFLLSSLKIGKIIFALIFFANSFRRSEKSRPPYSPEVRSLW